MSRIGTKLPIRSVHLSLSRLPGEFLLALINVTANLVIVAAILEQDRLARSLNNAPFSGV